MRYRPLHDGWTLSSHDLSDVPATVPGCVHTDLLAAGLIDDPDRLDPAATVDDQLVTLLPGESAVFEITTGRELDTAALTRFPVLRCVNEAVRP